MSVYSVVFSPTGGTEKVMGIMGREFQVENTIDLTKSNTDSDSVVLTDEDLCLVGVPSYGGRVPATALDRLRQIKGNNAKAIMVVVYGNRAYEDTILELKNELAACGFRPVGGVAAIAEHSIMHRFASGRPDAQDEEVLRKMAQEIKGVLNSRGGNEELRVPGAQPYREYGGVPFKPQASSKCNKCGLCSVGCPTGAIPKDNPAATNKGKCISCMRCVSVCPQNARDLNKALIFAASQKMKKACNVRKESELFV